MAILIAVSRGPIDKARISDAVLADTIAAIVLRKSTAYSLISELSNTGYIENRGAYYLTDKGWHTLRNELNRIEQQRRILKQRLHA
jgi:DNA-binding PadR family transcriptional regulator